MRNLLMLFAAASLAACATNTPGVPEAGMKVSTSLVGGIDGKLGNDLDMDHLVGGRVQVRREAEDFPGVEVGLRLGVHWAGFSDTDAGVRTEVEGTELNAAPSIRYIFPTGKDSPWHPYVEGFVGYGHIFARTEISAPAGSASSRDDAGGIFGGIGAGLEYSTSNSTALHLGVEHTWSDYGFEAGDVEEREVLGLVGFTYTF